MIKIVNRMVRLLRRMTSIGESMASRIEQVEAVLVEQSKVLIAINQRIDLLEQEHT